MSESIVRLIRPYIEYDEIEDEFRDIFESGIFTRGDNVEAFRREMASYTGAKHAFLTTSATTALWTCLMLLGIGSGDEVVVSDFSFPATANVVEDVGALPVFADVSLETYNMLPEELERKITARTKAVIFVDACGNPSGLTDIKNICDKRGLPLVEDAACAIGSSVDGRRCGSIANLTCFSFHPRKLICTGEGGAITTDRDDWARWLDVKLNHGASGMKGKAVDFVDYGYNFRLPELQAVMGRKQLKKLHTIIQSRNRTRAQYVEMLCSDGYEAQKIYDGNISNVQSIVFRVPALVDRDQLIAELNDNGIEATLGTYCLSGTTYYYNKYKDVQGNARHLQDTSITLPCYDGVDFNRVVEIARMFMSRV